MYNLVFPPGFDYSKIIASEEVVTRPASKRSSAPPPDANGDVEGGNDGGNALAPPPSPNKSRKVSIFRGADGHPLESKHVAGIQLFKVGAGWETTNGRTQCPSSLSN